MSNILSPSPEKPEKQRIGSIDGWRMIAAMGVLYTHTWALLQFPSLNIAGINVMQFLNLWGNGVHLFFVISGFCFFLVLSGKPTYDLKAAAGFWKKRWLRIAPAFYVACTIYAVTHFAFNGTLTWRLFFNYVFLQNIVPDAQIEPIFWSLAVEWHFYLLLPIIFLFVSRFGVVRVTISILILQLIISLLHYKDLFMPGMGWYYNILGNIGHFAWGILLAYLFTQRIGAGFFSKAWSILVGFAVAYAGRTFFFTGFVEKMGSIGVVFRSIGLFVMTLGFACMIYSCLENKTLSAIWGNKYFSALGRVSYSFYLWHAYMLEIAFGFFGRFIPHTALGTFMLILIVLCGLLPLSFISFRLFESFYFRKKPSKQLANQLDNAAAR